MFALENFLIFIDYILFACCIFIVLGSLFITIKMRFVQLRFFPHLVKMIKMAFQNRKEVVGQYTIPPHRALFTAMSTTLGIGTIVAPVMAIYWGGPGALIGFLLTAFLGSAATFTEVGLSLKYRQTKPSGEIAGGPMQYLKHFFSPAVAKWYAMCGALLMMAWSGAQANQLAAVLDSPLLGDYRIPTFISGAIIAFLLLGVLVGGIQRISSFSSKLIPLMFTLYLGSCLWILGTNLDKLGDVLYTIFSSAFSPYALATGSLVGGIFSSLRWGILKGTQVTEAGVGTQTIPHSMAETNDPTSQAMLAMASTYSAGLIAFLSGCVALITKTWEDPSLPTGISMVAASFQIYFAHFGIGIIAISALLFAFGTIIGNSYNGSQCFGYLADSKKTIYYYILTACVVFLGTIAGVDVVWSVIDIVLAGMVVPHMAALVLYAHKKPRELLEEKAFTVSTINEAETLA